MNVPVSIVIPTRNEASNLARCLKSVVWASEIYVVDSKSTDATSQIAENFGASVVQFEYRGGWPKKKNWALTHLPFQNEWVLLLDADEVLCQGGREEIDRALKSRPEITGYWINRRFMFLGKWLKHAYYPNWNLRLFRHSLGRFERLVEGETNSGDVEIHEHVFVKGATGRLKTELEHYAFPSVESFIEKHNRYSNWEAQFESEMEKKGSGSLRQDRHVSFRRRVKMMSRKLPMRPFFRFWYVYFIQRGFLDGIEGYYFAQLHACYEWMSIIKTFELRRNASRRLGN
jgi:glycosyltransferase involved in cell wall biosynthesis